MAYTEDQKANILNHYKSIEEYEEKKAKKDAEKYLADTDYILVKLFEYTLTGQIPTEDYKDIFAKRENARNILRNLKKS